MVLKPAVRKVTDWEKAAQQLFRHRHRPERFGIVPLRRGDNGRAQHDQQARNQQHEPGVHVQPFFFTDAPADILPDDKTQTAADDQQRNDDADIRIAGKRGQRAVRTAEASHRVEAGIAEGTDGMKHTFRQSFPKARHRDKSEGKQQRTCQFKRKSKGKHMMQEPKETVISAQIHRLGKNDPLTRSNGPPHQCRNEHCHRHKAEPADLDERKDHALAEHAPFRRGVAHNQTGHTGGACGREERIDRVGKLPVSR